MPIIEGDPGDIFYVAGDIPFTNLDHLTDGTLVCAKPDLYYSARPEQLHRQVRRQLSGLVVLSTHDNLSVVPNNFVEVIRRTDRCQWHLGKRCMMGLEAPMGTKAPSLSGLPSSSMTTRLKRSRRHPMVAN
ncbi:hypothetical protein BKA56DRAFT_700329 [Ilyonectria sp. MPI-CAGE-AT-0026]|nr:hypothetical protein BKA56DRAFT_700329 [Ilyonectria sp. MPI-CAGE-AT-0026]